MSQNAASESLPPRHEDRVTVIMATHQSLFCLSGREDELSALPRWTVIDNASSDGTAAWIQTRFPGCRLLLNPVNEGYGRANNRGLAAVHTPYALLLNPDCRISPESIAALVECADRYPNAAVVGPRYLESDGKPQQSYRPFVHRRRAVRGPYVEPTGDLCTDFVTGAAMLINIALLRQSGFFDPWYFLYCEDEDLCWRAHRQGHAVMVAAGALAYHSAARSSPPKLATTFRRHYCHTLSKLYLRRRLGKSRTAVSLYAMSILVGSLLALPLRLLLASPRRLAQNLARIAAVLTAPLQLSRRECAPGPLMLLSSLLSISSADRDARSQD